MTDCVAAYVTDPLIHCRTRYIDAANGSVDDYGLEPVGKNLSTGARRQYMIDRRAAIYNSRNPFEYFLHGQEPLGDRIRLVLYGNKSVEKAHIEQWYADPKSPLFNEAFRRTITTTPINVLSWTTVAVSDMYLCVHILTISSGRFIDAICYRSSGNWRTSLLHKRIRPHPAADNKRNAACLRL